MADLKTEPSGAAPNSSVIIFPLGTCRRVCSRPQPEPGTPRKQPKPIMRTPLDGEDPIFAIIEHHRALADRYAVAIDGYSAAGNGPMEEETEAIADEACKDLSDFADGILIRSEPTTLAGIAAFLRYVRGLEQWEAPIGDGLTYDKDQPSGWVCDLCRTLESAIMRLGAR